MKTKVIKKEELNPEWKIIDAKDYALGRLATKAAHILRGKHKPSFQPDIPVGDFVIVINADKIKITGNKLEDKMYYRYSGYQSGLKATTLKEMLEKKPEEVILHAVKGMLPKNRLGKKLLTRIKVYRGEEHPHAAQNPILVNN